MKILHTADWHLGYRQYGMGVREDDFAKPLEEIGDIAVREQVDAVLVAGDIFDSYRPPASAVQAAKKFGDRMNAFNIPVLAIDGNHDASSGRWSLLCGFMPLGRKIGDLPMPTIVRDVKFSGIDFCRPQQLIDRLLEMETAKVDLQGGVLALHLELADLTAYSTAMSVKDLEPHLDALNVGYVALGHIHNPVEKTTERGRIYRYCGATEMNDLSELGPKTVDLVTVTDGTYTRETLTLKTRHFEVVDIDTVEAIDEKLVPILNDPETFWLVKVNLSAPGKPVARVEEVLKDRLYRLIPYGNRSIEEQVERTWVVVGLKDAISAFFAPDSDEAALISRMIDTPVQVKAIAQEYAETAKTGGGQIRETRDPIPPVKPEVK